MKQHMEVNQRFQLRTSVEALFNRLITASVCCQHLIRNQSEIAVVMHGNRNASELQSQGLWCMRQVIWSSISSTADGRVPDADLQMT